MWPHSIHPRKARVAQTSSFVSLVSEGSKGAWDCTPRWWLPTGVSGDRAFHRRLAVWTPASQSQVGGVTGALMHHWDFPGGSDSKASAYNAGDPGSIPGSGRSPGEGNGNPLQYSCLENPMDREAWWATVHGVAKSGTRLSDFTFTFNAPLASDNQTRFHDVTSWEIDGQNMETVANFTFCRQWLQSWN